ncbi:MurR/RpiR family transcriptional regulator [Jeongeupia sp. USM3]|uniref:MurR/RpiR family transcriptional regulator n=1 Tax=Jeongeupia sp. USM3 TaxID=1906741 RepID=UPI00089DECA1|nr:MurR/RpiR family transcriptional regulator [Jeongeupia sp. USM3]AOY00435.1 RpiR family transcriptional regulator [Jeongeupia sp. USM3]
MSTSDIVFQIRARYDQLSATEQKVADAVLADLAFAAGATINALAERAGVSIATISRFAKVAGCDDVRDLKLRLAQAGAIGARFLADAAEDNVFYNRICAEVEDALHQSLAHFSEAQFRAAAKLIDKARMTYVAGFGGASTMLGDETQFRLARLGYPVAACHDPVLLRMFAATLSERDVLLVLSVSGVTPELLDIADIARQYGARLVVISAPDSPLAERADVLLPFHVDETDFIYKPSASRYGMMLVIDVLATELALLHKEHSKEMLRRLKFVLDDYRGGGDQRMPLGD